MSKVINLNSKIFGIFVHNLELAKMVKTLLDDSFGRPKIESSLKDYDWEKCGFTVSGAKYFIDFYSDMKSAGFIIYDIKSDWSELYEQINHSAVVIGGKPVTQLTNEGVLWDGRLFLWDDFKRVFELGKKFELY